MKDNHDARMLRSDNTRDDGATPTPARLVDTRWSYLTLCVVVAALIARCLHARHKRGRLDRSASVVHPGRSRCGQARHGRGSLGRACCVRDRLDNDPTASIVAESVTAAITMTSVSVRVASVRYGCAYCLAANTGLVSVAATLRVQDSAPRNKSGDTAAEVVLRSQ